MENNLILYFDESGFTGENLLHEDQTTFAYSSINIDPQEAEAFVMDTIEQHRIQNGELKAVKLIRRDRGKKLIVNILEKFQDKIKISIHDKKFALSAKFFEYIFEPVLAQKSSLFYQLNFHKYIANYIYTAYIVKDNLVVDMINIFEKLMREKSSNYLDELIQLSIKEQYVNCKSYDNIMKIISFIKIHRDTIYKEVQDLPSWTVDLSITSLNALFSDWGTLKQPIVAYCDNSKPIDEQKEIFNGMMGRTDIIYSSLFTSEDNPIPITYNLKEIKLVDSKEYHGVQIADIIATASSYCFKINQQEDEFIKKVRSLLSPTIVFGSVFPDFSQIDLRQVDVQLNSLIFEELIERSKEQVSVLNDIEFYITNTRKTLLLNPI